MHRLDTLIIHKQVEGRQGWKVLGQKLRCSGPCVLFQGANAAFAANLLGHYPWFAVRPLSCVTAYAISVSDLPIWFKRGRFKVARG